RVVSSQKRLLRSMPQKPDLAGCARSRAAPTRSPAVVGLSAPCRVLLQSVQAWPTLVMLSVARSVVLSVLLCLVLLPAACALALVRCDAAPLKRLAIWYGNARRCFARRRPLAMLIRSITQEHQRKTLS